MCPVVTDARQATSVLLWAVEKMEGRYELFKSANVKNVKAYNALSEDELQLAVAGIRTAIRRRVDTLPSHADFIERCCAARPAATAA